MTGFPSRTHETVPMPIPEKTMPPGFVAERVDALVQFNPNGSKKWSNSRSNSNVLMMESPDCGRVGFPFRGFCSCVRSFLEQSMVKVRDGLVVVWNCSALLCSALDLLSGRRRGGFSVRARNSSRGAARKSKSQLSGTRVREWEGALVGLGGGD